MDSIYMYGVLLLSMSVYEFLLKRVFIQLFSFYFSLIHTLKHHSTCKFNTANNSQQWCECQVSH